MPQIKWTKEDVIKKFQEAVTTQLAEPGAVKPGDQGLANTFRDVLAKRKAGPGAATPPVTS